MSKLTKFKVRRSQFPLDFRIDDTTRDTNIKTLTAMPGTVFEEGTEETAEIYKFTFQYGYSKTNEVLGR